MALLGMLTILMVQSWKKAEMIEKKTGMQLLEDNHIIEITTLSETGIFCLDEGMPSVFEIIWENIIETYNYLFVILKNLLIFN